MTTLTIEQVPARYLIEEANANAVHIWEHDNNDMRSFDSVLHDVRIDINLIGVHAVLKAQQEAFAKLGVQA